MRTRTIILLGAIAAVAACADSPTSTAPADLRGVTPALDGATADSTGRGGPLVGSGN